MQTETANPVELTAVQPTWTDVARAVFRIGNRQMSIEDFTRTFMDLFDELEQRCPDTGYVCRNLLAAIEELHKSGFLDRAMVRRIVHDLRRGSPSDRK